MTNYPWIPHWGRTNGVLRTGNNTRDNMEQVCIADLTWSAVDTVVPNHEGSIVWTNDVPTTNIMFYRLNRLK